MRAIWVDGNEVNGEKSISEVSGLQSRESGEF